MSKGTFTKKRSRIKPGTLQLWSLCAIPLILVFLFAYLPMFGIIIAFKDYNYSKGIFGSDWNGFENFRYIFESNTFYRITRNTLVMNFLFIFLGIIAACTLAIFLYRLTSRRATKTYQTILITPNFISWVIVAYMAYAILHPENGVLNNILSYFGIGKVDWYGRPEAWPVILIITNIWKHIGMDSVIYYAALMGIDQSLLEAAQIDGAKKSQLTRYILIPSIKNLIIMLSILKIGNIFRADFGLFYQITRNVGELYATTDVIDTYIFRTMRESGDMGVSSAVGLLQSVVGMITVVLTNFIVGKIDSDSTLF